MVISDASFKNAFGKKNQLGYVIYMASNRQRAGIEHYSPCKLHGVFRSIIAVEIHALVNDFDNRYVIYKALVEILGAVLTSHPLLIDERFST